MSAPRLLSSDTSRTVTVSPGPAGTRLTSVLSRLTPLTSTASHGCARRSCCSAHKPSASPLKASKWLMAWPLRRDCRGRGAAFAQAGFHVIECLRGAVDAGIDAHRIAHFVGVQRLVRLQLVLEHRRRRFRGIGGRTRALRDAREQYGPRRMTVDDHEGDAQCAGEAAEFIAPGALQEGGVHDGRKA